jgi:molybdate transport system substrate-binding protein
VRILAGIVAVALLVAGCGDDNHSSASEKNRPDLVVSAATSLKAAFTAYGRDFDDAEVRFSFAGSDELAAQIQQGVKPDVFAAANTTLPEQLYAKGLVEKPSVFAANRLVLAVRAGGTKVRSLDELAKPGITIAVGSPSVPAGAYTRKVLAGLGAARSEAILDNVRSNEPDVGGVVGKITQGAVDAGFVYVTDARAAGDGVHAIELPARLQPQVAYGVAIVNGAPHPEEARAFIDGLLRGAGRRAVERAGFELPPAGS